MKKISTVIGANYGDEGKGLVTSQLSLPKNTLNILNNGSCQRAHTVEFENGIKHVFHHFGSGTFNGATTCFSKFFIVNPIFFNVELEQLKAKGITPNKVICSKESKLALPYDAFINQILHFSKGNYGTCGFGVWETEVRNETHPLSFYNFLRMEVDEQHEYLSYVANQYSTERLRKLGIKTLPKQYEELFYSSNLKTKFIQDCLKMQEFTQEFYSGYAPVERFDNIVIENGQGLLLDQNTDSEDTCTPSNTGVKNIKEIIAPTIDGVFNNFYISRAYLTRHGNGQLDNEKSNPFIDETNVFNQFQGGLRFAELDVSRLENRILQDSTDAKGNVHLVFTHTNEVNVPKEKLLYSSDIAYHYSDNKYSFI